MRADIDVGRVCPMRIHEEMYSIGERQRIENFYRYYTKDFVKFRLMYFKFIREMNIMEIIVVREFLYLINISDFDENAFAINFPIRCGPSIYQTDIST